MSPRPSRYSGSPHYQNYSLEFSMKCFSFYNSSFGYCDKIEIKGHKPVGHYGNGFKSGSMRLGKDALVFTKRARNLSVGLLSQTYLKEINSETVLVPIVSWDATTNILFVFRIKFSKCGLTLNRLFLCRFIYFNLVDSCTVYNSNFKDK